MLDARARRYIDPPLNFIGRRFASNGITANQVTFVGLIFGILTAVVIILGYPLIALIPMILSRLADGIDGAVARAAGKTDFGGYLDIVCDFLFYGLVPMAFIWMEPSNALSGAFLLTSFYFNGASFLGFAILAERHGLETKVQGVKSLYYSNGLLEGTETIIFFIALCVFPAYFPPLAWAFGGLCFVTASLRIWGARQLFSN